MASIFVDILLFAYAIVAPGVGIAAVAIPQSTALQRAAAGLTISLFVVPLLHFVAAIAAQTHVSRGLLMVDATLVLAACGAVALLQRRNGPREADRTHMN